MERQLRPLLPAKSNGSFSTTRPVLQREITKRTQAAIACDQCRKRKIRCDGNPPPCTPCRKRSAVCVFTGGGTRAKIEGLVKSGIQLRKENDIYKRICNFIGTRPQEEADEIVRRLRAGTSVESLLRFIEDGDLLVQAMLAPVTQRRRYEFPYLSEMPVHLSSSSNPYMESLLYQSTLSQPGFHKEARTKAVEQQSLSNSLSQEDAINSSRFSAETTSYSVLYQVPYSAAQVIEPKIEKITTLPWTRVISDDRLLRQLVSSYFQFFHPCGPFVHKDSFLDDMVAGRRDFCSPLLVNAILSLASQSCRAVPNRSKMWLPGSLTYQFIAEARRLWDMESKDRPRITTIQAALTLSFMSANNGMDLVGTAYMKQACDMCGALGLFGAHGKNEEDQKTTVVQRYTACAAFSWQAMYNYFYCRPPIVESTPYLSLPDADEMPQWYGEVLVRYPHGQAVYPVLLGHKLKAEAALHTIMNEMGLLVFGKSSTRSIAVDDIVRFLHSLETWRSSLPEPLRPLKLVLPLHLTLHVQYHYVVMMLMQWIMNSGHSNDLRILNLLHMKSPTQVRDDARAMLETVMRLYYARHDFEHYDPWITFVMAAIGNIAVTELAGAGGRSTITEPRLAEGYRSTLVLSAQALNKQALNFHVSKLVAIQLESSIQPSDLMLVQRHTTITRASTDEETLVAEQSDSMWPVPGTEDIYANPDKVRLTKLIVALKDMPAMRTPIARPS